MKVFSFGSVKLWDCQLFRQILACVAGVIEEGEGEQGRREKMRGIGERGEGME